MTFLSQPEGRSMGSLAQITEPQADPFVRFASNRLSALSDIELTDYIHVCAERFLAAQRRWEATGCFDAVGERDAWWHAEADALVERGSRPHIVAQMERERGLA
jgi:hypothetical protein